jgi:TonB family protein
VFYWPCRRYRLAIDFGGDSSIYNGVGKVSSRLALLLCICILATGSPSALLAQFEDHPTRKILQSQKPQYPGILKTLGIGGVVRLNARVLANGTVAQISVVGGNPVLAESAVKAVMTWKFAPAAAASNEAILLDFKGTR